MNADRYILEIAKNGRAMMWSPHSGCLVHVPDLAALEDMLVRIRERTRTAIHRYREGRGGHGASGQMQAFRNAWAEYRGANAYVVDIRRIHRELAARRAA